MLQKINHLKELSVHKKFLIDSCLTLATYFIQEDEEDLALNLMNRAFLHDISKISSEEFSALTSFDSYCTYSKDKHLNFSDSEMEFLQMHWKGNKHHPEHWDDVRDMQVIDIAEMVCDWHARSAEFGNNLLEYIQDRQVSRFAFPDEIYSMILKFAKILES